MEGEAIQIVMGFKEKIDDALLLFEKMSPTEKVESTLLWNSASEKIQDIINRSIEALKNISVIVVQNKPSHGTEINTDCSESINPLKECPGTSNNNVTALNGDCRRIESVMRKEGRITGQNARRILNKDEDGSHVILISNQSTSDMNGPVLQDGTIVDSCFPEGSSGNKDSTKEVPGRSSLGHPDFSKMGKVVEKNRWSCKSCEKQFDDYVLLQNHISCDHSAEKSKPFKCSVCEATFSTKSNYNVHLRRHSGERPFACPKCSVRFTTSNNLRRHLLSHQRVKPYRCSVCDSRFAEKRSLQIHLRKHTGERPFSCPECSETFKQKSVLRSHIASHSTEKPFLCSDCGQSFKKKNLLRVHEIRHHGEKSHACHYCKSTFYTKSELNRHEQSHRGEKRFQCKEENCGKSFMRKQSLREHMNRHEGIKPYKCEKCPNAYAQLSEYLKHYKKHPPEIPDQDIQEEDIVI